MSSCSGCASNVRFRWLAYRLSIELFGRVMPLAGIPQNRSVKGIGLTDPGCISAALKERFSYRNTFFDTEPRLDIRTDPSPLGPLDFLIASEVFEHVEPPVLPALKNAASLLKRPGFLLLTVPWVWDGFEPLPELYDWKLDSEDGRWVIVDRRPDGRTERYDDPSFDNGPGRSLGRIREHFPHLHDWRLYREAEIWKLENKRADGTVETFHNLVFHEGPGLALEMRLFTKNGIEEALKSAGFTQVEFEFRDYPDFGIIFGYPWSRPVVARKS